MSVQVSESRSQGVSKSKSLCDTLPEDKAQVCNIVIEDHASMKINTKQAEEKLSALVGEEVKLVEEPDWKMLPRDKDVLESWATAACLLYTKDDQQQEICVDQVDKVVTGRTSLEEAAKKIGKMCREDPEEVSVTLIATAPNAANP